MEIVLLLEAFPKNKGLTQEEWNGILKDHTHIIKMGNKRAPVTQRQLKLIENGSLLLYPDYFTEISYNFSGFIKYPNFTVVSITDYDKSLSPLGFPNCLTFGTVAYDVLCFNNSGIPYYGPGDIPALADSQRIIYISKEQALTDVVYSESIIPAFKKFPVLRYSVGTYFVTTKNSRLLRIIPHTEHNGCFICKDRGELIKPSSVEKESFLNSCKEVKYFLGRPKNYVPDNIIKTIKGLDEDGTILSILTYRRCVAPYHSGHRPVYGMFNEFCVGVEVEKEDILTQRSISHKAFNILTGGWRKERDGSLQNTGFELVSPVYDLMDSSLENSIKNNGILLRHINSGYSSRCGGHINISKRGETPSGFFNTIKGYLPLLYALYPNRIYKTYSKAKKIEEYYTSDKYSSVFIKNNRVELRIFPAVANLDDLMWRIRLVRHMVANPNVSEVDIMHQLKDPGYELHSLIKEYVDTKYYGNELYKKRFESKNTFKLITNLIPKYSLLYNNVNLKI